MQLVPRPKGHQPNSTSPASMLYVQHPTTTRYALTHMVGNSLCPSALLSTVSTGQLRSSNPATGAIAPGDDAAGFETLSPMNSVNGSCGTSTLTLYSKTSGSTAYNLTGWFGAAVYHTRKVSLSARTGNTIVDRSGVPPIPGVSLNWGTNFSYNVGASSGATVSGVASGVVETTLGNCSSGTPRDRV